MIDPNTGTEEYTSGGEFKKATFIDKLKDKPLKTLWEYGTVPGGVGAVIDKAKNGQKYVYTDENGNQKIVSEDQKNDIKAENALKREERQQDEIQDRNDNAFSRMIEDILNSGVNPNLVNLSASPNYQDERLDYSNINTLMDQAFEAGENRKDRLTKLLMAIMGIIGLIAKGGSKK